jgi:glycosyltransferase involved in cell wall biosynthesis
MIKIKEGFNDIKNFLIFLKTKQNHSNLADISVFTNYQNLFLNSISRFDLESNPDRKIRLSLVVTVLNEEKHAQNWISLILGQTRLPDELVIVDGGSKDQTVNILKSLIVGAPFPVKILEKQGANISTGRNLGIRNTLYDTIVVSDMGSEPVPNWLEYLIRPFEKSAEISVSYGFSDIKADSSFMRLVRYLLVPSLEKINPQTHLPSSRCIAFTKNLWGKVNGYPEWLTDAGEDTLFDLELQSIPSKWAFVPEAVVYWYAPKSFNSLFKKMKRYAIGDGEAAISPEIYYAELKTILKVLFLLLGLIGLTFFSIPANLSQYLFPALLSIVFALIVRKYLLVLNDLPKEDRNIFFFTKFYTVLIVIRFYRIFGFYTGYKHYGNTNVTRDNVNGET